MMLPPYACTAQKCFYSYLTVTPLPSVVSHALHTAKNEVLIAPGYYVAICMVSGHGKMHTRGM